MEKKNEQRSDWERFVEALPNEVVFMVIVFILMQFIKLLLM